MKRIKDDPNLEMDKGLDLDFCDPDLFDQDLDQELLRRIGRSKPRSFSDFDDFE